MLCLDLHWLLSSNTTGSATESTASPALVYDSQSSHPKASMEVCDKPPIAVGSRWSEWQDKSHLSIPALPVQRRVPSRPKCLSKPTRIISTHTKMEEKETHERVNNPNAILTLSRDKSAGCLNSRTRVSTASFPCPQRATVGFVDADSFTEFSKIQDWDCGTEWEVK